VTCRAKTRERTLRDHCQAAGGGREGILPVTRPRCPPVRSAGVSDAQLKDKPSDFLEIAWLAMPASRGASAPSPGTGRSSGKIMRGFSGLRVFSFCLVLLK